MTKNFYALGVLLNAAGPGYSFRFITKAKQHELTNMFYLEWEQGKEAAKMTKSNAIAAAQWLALHGYRPLVIVWTVNLYNKSDKK